MLSDNLVLHTLSDTVTSGCKEGDVNVATSYIQSDYDSTVHGGGLNGTHCWLNCVIRGITDLYSHLFTVEVYNTFVLLQQVATGLQVGLSLAQGR